MNLPAEILFHIFEFNLSPRNLETRTSQLLTCCLLNKSFLSTCQPKLLEHLYLKGAFNEVGAQLEVVRRRLVQGEDRAWSGVKTVTCVFDLSPKWTKQSESMALCGKVIEVFKKCGRITELAFHAFDHRLDLYSLLSACPKLRVLHLSSCDVDEWPTDDSNFPEINTESLRYLASTRMPCYFPVSVLKSLKSVQYFSASRSAPKWDDFYNDTSGEPDELHQISSLRINQDEFDAYIGHFLPKITSFEILDCVSLNWFGLDFDRLERLHASATGDNLQLLASRIKSGSSGLKQIRLSFWMPTWFNRNYDSLGEEEWEIAKRELEAACKAHGVQLDFRPQQCFSAVEFWEETTEEEFLISGFKDGTVVTAENVLN